MANHEWPTFEELSHSHQIPLSTLHQRYRKRKANPGVEVWRQRPQDPYRINPDHVGVLLSHGRTPPWQDPQVLAEEYMFMCHSFRDEHKAVRRLADAYDREPRTITRALKETTHAQ